MRLPWEAWDIGDSLNEIKLQKGKQFEPKLVNLFINNIDSVLKIYNENIDPDSLYLGDTLDTKRRAIFNIISHECIIHGGNPVNCIAHKLRNLSSSEINEYVDKLSEAECSNILNIHMACIVNS